MTYNYTYSTARSDNLTAEQRAEQSRASRVDRMLINPIFVRACRLAQVEPTVRQASKYINGHGAAWQHAPEAIAELERLEEGRELGSSMVGPRSVRLDVSLSSR